MKHCSKGHNNPDDAVFCAECGEKLDQRTSELREPADLETTPITNKFPQKPVEFVVYDFDS